MNHILLSCREKRVEVLRCDNEEYMEKVENNSNFNFSNFQLTNCVSSCVAPCPQLRHPFSRKFLTPPYPPLLKELFQNLLKFFNTKCYSLNVFCIT